MLANVSSSFDVSKTPHRGQLAGQLQGFFVYGEGLATSNIEMEMRQPSSRKLTFNEVNVEPYFPSSSTALDDLRNAASLSAKVP